MADTARPRAGEEHEALAPKAAERAATPARRAPGAALPAGARPRPVRMPPGALQRLGATAGNRAVANLLRGPAAPAPAGPAPASNAVGLAGGAGAVAEPGLTIQRYAGLAKGGGGSYAPPAPPVAPDPKGDSRFAKVAAELKKAAKETKAHPPAKVEAKKAADAAKPPANDKEAQAKASQADKMAGAKKGGFDKAAFIAAVKQAIAAAAPQSLEDADKFADSGKAEGVKTQVMGKVAKGKEDSAKDVAEKTKEPPDPSKATEKPVKALEEQKETKPQPPGFAKAMPAKVPAEQTDFEGPKNEVADQMAAAEVSESDLKKSNEPQMVAAVEAKKEGDEHSAKAPGEIRAKEAEVRKEAEAGADQKGKGDLEAMVGAKKGALTQTGAKKDDQKSKDEAKRAEIAAELNKIYDRTKGDVEKILTDLDAKVDDAFTKGEAEVRLAFTNEHKGELQRFKDRRYAGAEGAIQWGIDLFKNLSEVPEVKRIYERAKANYERGMERVISNVADLVGGEIDRAKDRIAKGRQEIKDWVARQPKDIQKLADEAAKGMDEKFNQLESDVDNKSESLASDLAEKYTTALGEVNKEIEEAQAANRSAWSKAKAAVGESLEAIMKLKDLFMGLLAKAAGAFKKILADPLAFIGNFMSAVKAGFMGFVNKIGEYLKKGLQGWLFGKLGEAGIEIPDKLDLPGILKMVLSILGLTWAALRSRIVKRIGEKAMKVLEGASDIFIVLVKEGVPGLWKWIVDKVGDLKEMVVGQIRSFVIEKIVKAGITWVIGMLNPAGALIKIVQALISVIQWIMEKGGALVELVSTIVDSVSDIAHGGMGGVPAKIEGALAKAVPIVISFLASLLGLGGIGEKIKSILDTVRGPVGKAVDAVIAGALKLGKSLIMAASRGGAPGGRADPEHARKVSAGLAAIDQEEKPLLQPGGGIKRDDAQRVAAKVRREHPVFKSVAVVDGGSKWSYRYVASPPQTKEGEQKAEGAEEELPVKVGDEVIVRIGKDWHHARVDQIDQSTKLIFFKSVAGSTRRGMPFETFKNTYKDDEAAEVQPYLARAKGNGPYKDLPDPPGVGPYKAFTASQKNAIIAENRRRNSGKLVSDVNKSECVLTTRRTKGAVVDPNEVNIDHIYPRSKGGWNTFANAQVLSFSENLKKLDKVSPE